MSKYRTIDCEKWARDFLRQNPSGQLIHIRPTSARVLGEVIMPDGSRESSWHYHYAVLYLGKMHDEA